MSTSNSLLHCRSLLCALLCHLVPSTISLYSLISLMKCWFKWRKLILSTLKGAIVVRRLPVRSASAEEVAVHWETSRLYPVVQAGDGCQMRQFLGDYISCLRSQDERYRPHPVGQERKPHVFHLSRVHDMPRQFLADERLALRSGR